MLASLALADSHELVEKILEDDKRATGCTRGTTQGFWRLRTLSPDVCRVTFVFQVTAGGSVPVAAMNFGVKTGLSIAERLRDRYERNGEAVDAELRRAMPPPPLLRHLESAVGVSSAVLRPYVSNDKQTSIMEVCLSLEAEADSESDTPWAFSCGPRVTSAAARAWAVKGSWVELKSSTPFVSLAMKYTVPEGNESR
jgi:hypothetical protein